MARDPATNSATAAQAPNTAPDLALAQLPAPPGPDTEAAAEPANYRRAFWTSWQHVCLAALTLGLGLVSGQRLGLLIGATLYVLGLIFVPDLAFFRRAVDARNEKARQAAQQGRVDAYRQRRDQLVSALSGERQRRYHDLAAICHDVESAIQPDVANDPDRAVRHQKLEEIGWTYLRLLASEQALDRYLTLEKAEHVPEELSALQAETKVLFADVQAMMSANPRPAALDDKQRLLTSRLERLKSLEERMRRVEQAQTKHDYLLSEQVTASPTS